MLTIWTETHCHQFSPLFSIKYFLSQIIHFHLYPLSFLIIFINNLSKLFCTNYILLYVSNSLLFKINQLKKGEKKSF